MKNFSIVRSFWPMIFQVMSIIVVGELIFALFIFTMIEIRNTLKIDYTFAGLFWLAFFSMVFVILTYTYKAMVSWASVSYYVLDNKLVINKHLKSSKTRIKKLNGLSSFYIQQSRWEKKFDYGNIVMNFSNFGRQSDVKLIGVVKPYEISVLLNALMS